MLFDEAAGAAPAGDGSDEAWLHFLTELHNARGTALYHLGDFAGAIAAFETTLAITPWPRNQNSQYARGWIARCQDQLGGE
ncbi:MAG: tetratricopeptide repeat protein [Sumerlaeia bacterium]